MKAFRRALINDNEGLIDVKEILQERSQRFRIRDSIFEETVSDLPGVNNNAAQTLEGEFTIVPKIQNINFKRNGMDIFNDANAGHLFDEETLYLKLIQSKSPKMTSHPIYHISRADIYEVILKGFLKQKMHKQTISNQISEFLFFLMSGHSSELLVEACFDTLKYHLQSTSSETGYNIQAWKPSIEDIMSVFINYGASKDLLKSDNVSIPQTGSSDRPICRCILTKFPKKNFFWVLRFLSAVLLYDKNIYTIKDLDHLLSIILTVSLDRHFVQMETHESLEVSKCIKQILKLYPRSEWEEKGKVSDISKKLYAKLRYVNINDLFFIISYFVSSPGFGQKLEQSLSLSLMNNRVWPMDEVSYFDNVEVNDMCKIFQKDALEKMDYYTQYYILLNLERSITYIIFTSNQLTHLQRIRKFLSNLRIKKPLIEELVDYLLVKELITRAATMWKLSIAEVT